MKSYTKIIIKFVFILLFSCTTSESFMLPGFQGYVFDKESEKPIENAYVICFTDYYSFGQRFNLGGPNSRPDSMQIARTDSKGGFIIEPYKKYFGGWADYRTIYFIKEGYLYTRQYVQLTERKDVLRENATLYMPAQEIPLKAAIKIYLSNKEQPKVNGEVIGNNGYAALLYRTRNYCEHFKYNNAEQFKKWKPFFIDLYRIYNQYSEQIVKKFTEPRIVEDWKYELKRFRENLED